MQNFGSDVSFKLHLPIKKCKSHYECWIQGSNLSTWSITDKLPRNNVIYAWLVSCNQTITLQLRVQLYRKFATSYRPFLVTLDQDLCSLFDDENQPLAKVIDLKGHRNFGNLYDPCPMSVNLKIKKHLTIQFEGDHPKHSIITW